MNSNLMNVDEGPTYSVISTISFGRRRHHQLRMSDVTSPSHTVSKILVLSIQNLQIILQ